MANLVLVLAGEPAAPKIDTPPQADEQTRNQDPAAAAPPKVKSEKECMPSRPPFHHTPRSLYVPRCGLVDVI